MSERPATPWTARARTATAAGLLVGAALVVVGALGAASEERVPDEVVWLNVGVAGVVVGGATVLGWLLALRRAVTAARNQVIALYAADLDTSGAVVERGLLLGRQVTVAGSSWHHQPDCLLTAGKPLLEVGAGAGLTPCPVCGG